MVRSHWLRVRGTRLKNALFGLGFPPAPGLQSLGLAAHRDSQAYSTKDTPQAPMPAASWRSMVSGSLSLPSPGFFSPFPHGTSSLSVAAEYSALDRGRPGFRQGSSCPALLRHRTTEAERVARTGLSPSLAELSGSFRCAFLSVFLRGSSPCGPTTPLLAVWAPPLPLAATQGISVDFFSRVT